MKIRFFFLFLWLIYPVFSQVDYSSSWADFYSYNHVKQFVKSDGIIYALADNAVFTFEEATNQIEKFSSVQGLSGETTSSFYFDPLLNRIAIGYENGLLEIIDEEGNVIIASDIVNFSQTGEKRINHIAGFNNKLYLATSFAIVEYDIQRLEFGDTFFIGSGSSSLSINETIVKDEVIYAATENGLFTADATSDLLIDFNNWNQFLPSQDISNIVVFNDEIYLSSGSNLYALIEGDFNLIRTFSDAILNLNGTGDALAICFENRVEILDDNLNILRQFASNEDYSYTTTDALFENESAYISTEEYGVLKVSFNSDYQEIHPDGPLHNDVFSIAVKGKDLWVVYGGYDLTYTPTQRRKGFSHFNGEAWVNQPFDDDYPLIDLNHISIDPTAENKVYISSFGDTRVINSVSTGGLLVVENDEIQTFYNHQNSSLEDIVPQDPSRVTVRVSGTEIDNNGNLWVANISFNEELKKRSSSGAWSSFDLSSLKSVPNQLGLSEIAIDRSNSIWMGTRRNGLYVYNENGNRMRALVNIPNQGNLPDTDVLSLTVDKSNRIWIGTRTGLVTFSNPTNVFDADVINARPIIIEENGIGERLLGDQRINAIAVDGGNNKWFGTESGGLLYTDPTGRETIANFNTQNSPLPSNKILEIKVDEQSGMVYIATDKGIVSYDSNVAPFGDSLEEVYAYPNPALSQHNTVTIDGRFGKSLPKGTNVKIVDVAGNLVYETNVVEGQQLQGGRVVWDKTNLAGQKVATGIYIVLLSNEDASENATAKIAIVN